MTDVKHLMQELLELEAARPEMPRGLHAEHPEFIRWHLAFQAHVDKKQLLLSKITSHLHPVETGQRQERPMKALAPLPSRIRQ